MNFSTRLKEEIELADLRYKELAAKTGVAERALYNYVATKNPSMPPADIAVKIAKALGVSVEYLVTGKVNEPQAENQDFQKIHKYAGLIAKIDQLSDRQKALLQELVTELAS
ncbi:MAG: helix-turn-helix transcriptional regulator [Treponema sp.]|nr:helix-turn-helix transcriptional regulator [Treponema sp.]MBQ6566730.1 helix-turn-helix transcriptional regulator [Treponema sp.]MBQ7167886.1 helix-turn-helix transcriptional regulator [Treponema sp.]